MDIDGLFARALGAASASYSPYSHFRVGAAILCADDSIVTGANVENRSFGLTTCAERNALVSAVGQGKHKFSMIAIATPDSDYPVSPCGACRQALSEFMGAETPVVFGHSLKDIVVTTIGQLFPYDALHELAK
jgi:cytidine deaminase